MRNFSSQNGGEDDEKKEIKWDKLLPPKGDVVGRKKVCTVRILVNCSMRLFHNLDRQQSAL